MFCPRCGQQPVSNAIRFCANCGLRLEGVSYLLTNDGVLPSQSVVLPSGPTMKQREMRRGAKILFSSFISFPLLVALSIASDGPGPILIPLTLFIAGICWILYAKFFCDDHLPWPQKSLPVQPNSHPVCLPQAPSQVSIPPIRTAEIEPPQSVIEHTTRQLIKE